MILVSACLAGERCRYDGQAKPSIDLIELVEKGEAISVCPEVMGGLPIPRLPSEKLGEKVLNSRGEDVTHQFNEGAMKAWSKIENESIERAILKTKSPMCGAGTIYDGTFSGSLIKGDGVFTKLLKSKNIPVESRD